MPHLKRLLFCPEISTYPQNTSSIKTSEIDPFNVHQVWFKFATQTLIPTEVLKEFGSLK